MAYPSVSVLIDKWAAYSDGLRYGCTDDFDDYVNDVSLRETVQVHLDAGTQLSGEDFDRLREADLNFLSRTHPVRMPLGTPGPYDFWWWRLPRDRGSDLAEAMAYHGFGHIPAAGVKGRLGAVQTSGEQLEIVRGLFASITPGTAGTLEAIAIGAPQVNVVPHQEPVALEVAFVLRGSDGRLWWCELRGQQEAVADVAASYTDRAPETYRQAAARVARTQYLRRYGLRTGRLNEIWRPEDEHCQYERLYDQREGA